jgi:hypothetical protein
VSYVQANSVFHQVFLALAGVGVVRLRGCSFRKQSATAIRKNSLLMVLLIWVI